MNTIFINNYHTIVDSETCGRADADQPNTTRYARDASAR
jgi:hypothetical protein